MSASPSSDSDFLFKSNSLTSVSADTLFGIEFLFETLGLIFGLILVLLFLPLPFRFNLPSAGEVEGLELSASTGTVKFPFFFGLGTPGNFRIIL